SSNTLLHNYQSQKTSEDSYNVWLEVLTLLEIDKDDPEYASAPEPQDVNAPGGSGMGWVKFSALATHDHSESNREAGLHIEFDTVSNDTGWIPLPIQEMDLDQEFRGTQDTKLRHELGGLFNQVHLSKKIRRELQSVSRTRTVTNKRRGKLHKRALYKTAADAMAKVFKQRDVRFTPKTTSVMLLQDWSGSMGCNKFKTARVATHEVGRVLKSLKLAFAIYGFSTRCTDNLLFKMKSFSETFSTEKYKHRCVNASHNMHS
ncbi:MAG: hypothetical protein GY829_14980, partial [Gammaproteobacteria bacterium]|nr:hypothetical protein [Gammaproteobacteria bacterium]